MATREHDTDLLGELELMEQSMIDPIRVPSEINTIYNAAIRAKKVVLDRGSSGETVIKNILFDKFSRSKYVLCI